MERRDVLGALGVGAVGLTLLSGCETPKPTPDQIRSILKSAGKSGSYYGLKKWAEKQEGPAKECASTLSANITGTLIPYLDGGSLPSSAEIQAFINSSLFKGVDPAVKEAILAASIALDAVLPIPAAGKFLGADEISYIKAFMVGLSEGCNKFLGATDKAIETVWLK